MKNYRSKPGVLFDTPASDPQPHVQDVLFHDLTRTGNGFENYPEMCGTTAGDDILHRCQQNQNDEQSG